MSSLTRLHCGHRDRHYEIEITNIDVCTKASGELQRVSMRIKCKLIPALVTPHQKLRAPGYKRIGHLELIENMRNSPNEGSHEQSTRVRAVFAVYDFYHLDPEYCRPRQAFMVVIQRCQHDPPRRGKNSVQDDEMSQPFTEHPKREVLEGCCCERKTAIQPRFRDSGCFWLNIQKRPERSCRLIAKLLNVP